MISQEPRPRSSRISRSSNTIMLRELNSSLTDYKKRNRYHIGVGKSNRLCDDEDSITTRRGVGARRRKWRSPWNYPISGIPLPFLFLLRLNEFVFSFGSWDPTKPVVDEPPFQEKTTALSKYAFVLFSWRVQNSNQCHLYVSIARVYSDMPIIVGHRRNRKWYRQIIKFHVVWEILVCIDSMK